MATRTLQEAEAALRQGGLTGRSLDMALTSLRNSYTAPPPQSGQIRDIQLRSGDPASSLMRTSAGAEQVAQTADPYAKFNEGLMQLLTRHQSLGTKRFQEQGFNAQEAQNDRVSARTPSDLIGASPGIQNSVRGASAGALDPTINQARQAQQTFGEQINSYGSAIESARSLVAAQQARADKERDDARAVIKDALTLGGADSLNSLAPEELKQLEKLAGYPAGYVQGLAQTLKERELQLKTDQAAALQAMGGLTPAQINSTVNSIAGAFDNEPIVKNYNTTQEGYNTIKSIGVNTSSPADDIAFIYAFAKIMDPNSVVREGEYATIQRYAQTWADNFGFKAQRIFTNTNFLSADAKQKMLNALQPKVKTIENQYKNLESEYQRQIDDAYSGQPRQLTNYGGGNTTGSGGGERKTINGVEYERVEGGWQKVSFSNGGAGTNRPQRNNNPLNIKASQVTMSYPGVVGVDPSPATDGGKFLKFASAEDGFSAAKRLITSSGYANLSVDAALRRWSGGGYGAEIVPNLRGKTINSLTPAELSNLINTMAKREGAFA